jgi:hypothetical protein
MHHDRARPHARGRDESRRHIEKEDKMQNETDYAGDQGAIHAYHVIVDNSEAFDTHGSVDVSAGKCYEEDEHVCTGFVELYVQSHDVESNERHQLTFLLDLNEAALLVTRLTEAIVAA